MKNHPYERLNRPMVGQGLGRVRPAMCRVLDRKDREIKRIVEFSTPRELRRHGVRTLRVSVEAGPNTPLLIRLLRRPFTMSGTSFRVQTMPSRVKESRPERDSFRREIEEALRTPRRIRSLRPTEFRIKLQPRHRSSLEEWLSSENS